MAEKQIPKKLEEAEDNGGIPCGGSRGCGAGWALPLGLGSRAAGEGDERLCWPLTWRGTTGQIGTLPLS